MDPFRRRLAPQRAASANTGSNSLFELGDVFADARGNLRVGLLGCGDIATSNAAAIAAAPNVELTACYDPTARLAEGLARSHGAAVTSSAEELVDRSDVDAVLISVPHYLHAPLAELAIAAGRHVIVEKPLAQDLESAARIVTAARAAGVSVSVNFPQRYEPAALVAKRLVDAGVLGEFGGSLIRLFLDKTPAYWLGGFSGRTTSDWRSSQRLAGGGVLIMNLSHHIDLVRHLCGVEVEHVSAIFGATDERRDVEDAITVGVQYVGGAVGSMIGVSAVRGETQEEVRVWGRDGHVVLAPSPGVFTLRSMQGLRATRWHTYGHLPVYSARALYLSRLGSDLAAGKSPEVSGEDGLAVQAVISAVYRSAESGTQVSPSKLLSEVSR